MKKEDKIMRVTITNEKDTNFEVILYEKDANIIMKECLIFKQSYEKRKTKKSRFVGEL